MRKLIFKNHQSPGDVMMLTAAVRDLHGDSRGSSSRTYARLVEPGGWHS
jgi:hypothetical protein